MRTRVWLQSALALAVCGLPGTLWGQFQPPTDEELKMTAEPKVPGASAIYLYSEETDDDNLHFHSYFARIKVLTEKGKELATVTIPYVKGSDKITDIKARTIHADGKIIPLDIKPSDLVEVKNAAYQVNKMVFTLPSVEAGSILEYRYEERYDDGQLSSPTWEVQQKYFVRKAHYSFTPFKYMGNVVDSKGNGASRLLYSYNLPNGKKVEYESIGRYKLDIADVPPTPDEEFMPPIDSVLAHVVFYYTPYDTKEEYWKHEGGSWSKQMDRFAGASKALKEAVSQIIAPADSEEVKARKLYDAVMKLDNTDYTRSKSAAELKQEHMKAARDAEDVWTRKSGSSDEIALTYLAMARIAGLKAYALEVCDRNREMFNPFYLSLRQLDDVLVLVTINGKDVPLDPGTKFAEFGLLDWRHVLVSGIRQTDKGVDFGTTPGNPYKESVTLRTADLTIGKDGTLKGIARISMNGEAALHWRKLAAANDEDEVKKRFNEQMRGLVPDGVSAEFDHFLGLEDSHSQLMGIVNLSGNMGTATGKHVFLPGVFFESQAKHPFVAQEKRLTPVDMEYAETLRDEVTYHLPENFTVESAPAETSIPWAGHAAMQLKSVTKNNDVTVARVFIRGFALVAAQDYAGLRDFYQKTATADQQQMVLTMAPAAKAGTQ
jgi:hypothetical protein